MNGTRRPLCSPTWRALRAFAFVATCSLLWSVAASAQRTPAELRQALLSLGQSQNPAARINVAEHQYGNVSRVRLNPRGYEQLKAVEQVLHRSCNVLEICHVGYDKAQLKDGSVITTAHTFSVFNRTAPHLHVYNNWRDWSLQDLGMGNLRPSDRRTFSAMIQLTPVEAQHYQNTIALGNALQRAGVAVGEDAYLKASPKRLDWVRAHQPQLLEDPFALHNIDPSRGYNCASFYSEMKLGENGETLGQLTGTGSSGSPRYMQQAFETRGNDRVAGICVYHGPMPNGPGDTVFHFEPGSLK